MKIARIATETAELPSYEGVIDGRARVNWRRPAIFPLAGGGERQFISAQIAERRSIRVSAKGGFSVVVPLLGVYFVA